ncbi:hypothetical protein [Rhodococcus marinonascens]|uniref:hypothetical protein n=1 Tax=Rhodococcus marinonascens TaxID=38311 RepID=UPI000A4FD59E|nr:hypothetical protein [Rhodococcus marinonascens]
MCGDLFLVAPAVENGPPTPWAAGSPGHRTSPVDNPDDAATLTVGVAASIGFYGADVS